ncbi:phosphatidylinositol-specific phospholipase C domain-containing protein [Bacillus cereus]
MAYKTLAPATDHVYTQSISLEKQLNSGIRFLDMRCKVQDDIFWMYHGPYYLDNKFDFVLDRVTKFLKENPSETILMRVKQEAQTGEKLWVEDTKFNAILKKYMERFPTFFWDSKDGSIDNPTLGEMRGKIVILRDFYCSDIGLTYGYKFDTQDEYQLDTNWKLHDKWEKVREYLRKAQDAYPNKDRSPIINYLSGSGGVYPYFVASGHSSPGNSAPRLSTGLTTPGWASSFPYFPRTDCVAGVCTIAFEGTNILATNHIKRNDLKYTGIVVSDFPGPDLINAIIKVNDSLIGSEVPDDVYQIVTSLNGTSVVDLNRSDNEVTLWENNDGKNQKWKFVYDEKEGEYLIESMTDTNLLLAWNGSNYPRKVVVKQKPDYKPYPAGCYWRLKSLGEENYEIINRGQRVYPGDYIPLWMDVDHSGTTNGTKITVHESNSTKAQRFKLRKEFRIPDGIYKIVTALSPSNDKRRVVDLSSRKPGVVHLWDSHSGENQKWKFVYHEEKGAYQIQSVSNPDLVLVWIDVSSTPTYKNVMGHKNEHKEEHYWILEKLKDGYYIIKSKKNQELVLVVNGGNDNGTKIKVNERHPFGNAQKFKLERV